MNRIDAELDLASIARWKKKNPPGGAGGFFSFLTTARGERVLVMGISAFAGRSCRSLWMRSREEQSAASVQGPASGTPRSGQRGRHVAAGAEGGFFGFFARGTSGARGPTGCWSGSAARTGR